MQQAVRHAYGYGQHGRDYRKDFNILLWRSGEYSTPNKEWAVFFINIFLQHTGTWGLLVYYIIFYNILVWSAAPQTPLWRGPGPRFEPGTGGLETAFLIYLQTHSFPIVLFEGTVWIDFDFPLNKFQLSQWALQCCILGRISRRYSGANLEKCHGFHCRRCICWWLKGTMSRDFKPPYQFFLLTHLSP